MNAIEMIKGRRSVRKFKDEKVGRDLITEIVDLAKWSPSWANLQVARYTIIDDSEKIKALAANGVNGFVYNIDTLKNAQGVLVLSYVKGKSGKLNDADYATSKANLWETFDAGIACQTFCLAAHAKGVGTTIMGVIDADNISKIANLPEDETVAALIVFGFQEADVAATERKDVTEILRFVD